MEDIPLPLTERAWAPLVTKHHYLGRILDPWLPGDCDITSVNQSVLCSKSESSGRSGVKAAIASSQLLLGHTFHTTEGLARFSGTDGVQELVHRARQPHTRLGRAGEMLAGAGLGLRSHLGSAGMPEMAPAASGEEVQLERESRGFGKGLGKQPRNKEGREKVLFLHLASIWQRQGTVPVWKTADV